VFCSSCGRHLNASDLFCENCGQGTADSPVNSNTTRYPSAESQKSEAITRTQLPAQPSAGSSVGDAFAAFVGYVFGVTTFANVIFVYPIWLVTLSFPTPGVPPAVVAISTVIMILSGLLHLKN